MYKGFSLLRKYSDEIMNILNIMAIDSSLPCFKKYTPELMLESFGGSYTEKEVQNS